VQTNGGPSARSTPFVVQAAGTGSAPTVTGYTWTTTPTANQPFSGTITGTGFSSPIVVWFCPSSGSCQQLAASQVTLNSDTSLGVTGVTLTAGSWQLYVQTNGGPSARSTTFVVQSAGVPTISNLTVTTSVPQNGPWGIQGSLDFVDGDGNIVYADDWSQSAYLTFQYKSAVSHTGCTVKAKGAFLDKPNQTSGHIAFDVEYGGTAIITWEVNLGNNLFVTLTDAAGHTSNTLSAYVSAFACPL
jgi:hypothetical protein